MNTYTIKKISETPDWSAIPSLPIDQVYKAETSPVRAWAQVAYHGSSLFVRLRAEETDIRMEENGPLASTWEDSCLEFFFSPVDGDPRYINLEITPGGAYFMGIGTGKQDLMRLIPLRPENGLQPRVAFFDGGWEVSYELPYPFIRRLFPTFAPKSGDILRANFYKCGDKTTQPHWMSWSRVEAQPLNFHTPEYFGTLIFE